VGKATTVAAVGETEDDATRHTRIDADGGSAPATLPRRARGADRIERSARVEVERREDVLLTLAGALNSPRSPGEVGAGGGE
jgi:hypothetical protein